jgi:hypothetical protein
MSDRPRVARDSVAVSIAVAGVCAAIGIVALPLVFAQPLLAAAPWSTPVWLAIAIFMSVYLLAIALPRLSRPLAVELGSRVASTAAGPTVTPSQSLLVAQLVVLGALLVIVQAILRRPLALLLGGGERGSGSIEAAIAATVLALVLALLVWLYQSARPLMQSVTLRAIDAAIPTVAPAAQREPTRTVSVVSPVPEVDAATQRVSPVLDEPTLRAPTSADEPTLPARPTTDAATLPARPSADATPTFGAAGRDAATPTLVTTGRDTATPTLVTTGRDAEAPTLVTAGRDAEAPTLVTAGRDAEAPTLVTAGRDAETPTIGPGGRERVDPDDTVPEDPDVTLPAGGSPA